MAMSTESVMLNISSAWSLKTKAGWVAGMYSSRSVSKLAFWAILEINNMLTPKMNSTISNGFFAILAMKFIDAPCLLVNDN